jgi:pimeloyl-ACP methyl ester carboxylesterase
MKKYIFVLLGAVVVSCAVFTSPAEASTTILSDISADTTWSDTDSPYLVTKSIAVPAGVTLTLAPGAIVKLSKNVVITVGGTVSAIGTATSGVSITAYSDDTLGGDTNGNGSASLPMAKDSGGFVFSAGSVGTFENTEFRYATNAISATGAALTITDGAFVSNDSAVAAIDGSLTVTGTRFSLNTRPLRASFATTFTHSGNTFSGNTYNAIGLTNYVLGAVHFTLTEAPYVIYDPMTLVGMSAALTIDPGVMIMSGNGTSNGFMLAADGAPVTVVGTPTARIDLTHVAMIVRGSAQVNISYADIGIINSEGAATITMKDSTFRGVNSFGQSFTGRRILMDTTPIVAIEGATMFSGQRGTIILEDSILKNTSTGVSSAVYLYNNTIATIKNTVVESVTSCFDITSGATVTADHITMNKCHDTGIKMTPFNGSAGARLTLRDSEISGAMYGLWISGNMFVDIQNSSFHDNTFAAFTGQNSYSYSVTNNWWGDASGPENSFTNPGGHGQKTSDKMKITPWLTENPIAPSTPIPDPVPVPVPTPNPVPVPTNRTPVIIIPGITGTELVREYGNQEELWPSFARNMTNSSRLLDLSLNTNGTEDPQLPLRIGDIVRSAPTLHILDGLIADLVNAGYREGTDLFVFPYDWRLSNTESAQKLAQKIADVRSATEHQKVDLITHSMGGLIAKKYIADAGSASVRKLIFIGTPHLGSPKTFKVLMYGDDMGWNLFGFPLLSSDTIKTISQNMPAIYDLLPSKSYSQNTSTTSYVFDARNVSSASAAGSYLSPSQIEQYLSSEGRNSVLFPQAETLHSLTDGMNLSADSTYVFSGCGTTKTIGSFTLRDKLFIPLLGYVTDGVDIGYVNGDGTVPLYSADTTNGTHYYVKGSSHAQLPSADGVPQTIIAILNETAVPSKDSISTNRTSCSVSGTAVQKSGSVTMQIYDQQGRHTGVLSDGSIEHGIPGVEYTKIDGDVTFAFLPDGIQYRVVNDATTAGGYDFSVQKIGGDDAIVSRSYYGDIPVEATSSSEILIGGSEGVTSINMDIDGDNDFDTEYPALAMLDATQAADRIPPFTSATIDEEMLLTLTPSDAGAGILKTEYSLDGGLTWTRYMNTVNVSGKTVTYFSVDKAGNRESVRSITRAAAEVIPPIQNNIPPSTGGGGGTGTGSGAGTGTTKTTDIVPLPIVPPVVAPPVEIVPVVDTDLVTPDAIVAIEGENVSISNNGEATIDSFEGSEPESVSYKASPQEHNSNLDEVPESPLSARVISSRAQIGRIGLGLVLIVFVGLGLLAHKQGKE